MLDTKEAEKVYNQLSDIIRKAGLDWLIADVTHQISMGKQGAKDIQVETTLRSPQGDYLPKRKGRKAAFIVTQPLTENEKLLLLIEALEAATVGLSLGIVNCYEIIGEDNNTIQSFGFAADTEVNESMHVDSEILKRKKDVVQLQDFLKELKEVV
jgi:hypothetical protein